MRLIWIIVILVSACAPRVSQMALDRPVCTDCKYFDLYKDAIAINTITFAADTPDNPAESGGLRSTFEVALRNSLARAGLLVPIQAAKPFFLDVRILQVHRPISGLTMTAFVVIRYQLYRSVDRQLIHEDTIDSEATRGFADSVLVLDRSRLSLESAVRENIHKFLTRLLGN